MTLSDPWYGVQKSKIMDALVMSQNWFGTINSAKYILKHSEDTSSSSEAVGGSKAEDDRERISGHWMASPEAAEPAARLPGQSGSPRTGVPPRRSSLRSTKCSLLVVTAPLLHWYPADYSILKDHCQPHAEFSSPLYLHLKHITHYSKKSPHFYPMLTFKTFGNVARMSWNLDSQKCFKSSINPHKCPAHCPPRYTWGYWWLIHN